MERRLLKAIINPSMLAVFITGGILAYQTGYWQSTWLHVKIVLALGLGALHGYFARYVKIFAKGQEPSVVALFSPPQRGPDRLDGRDRLPRRVEAVF